MTRGGLFTAGWRKLEWQTVLCVCMTALRAGDRAIVPGLGDLVGVTGPRALDVMHELLLTASQEMWNNVMRADDPLRYVRGAVKQHMAEEICQKPQERMESLDAAKDTLPAAVLVCAGIDPESYIAEIARKDPALARAIDRWCGGATRAEIGPSLYRRMVRHFEDPDARRIARRSRTVVVSGSGWMAPPTWFYTCGLQVTSVLHQQNRRLLG